MSQKKKFDVASKLIDREWRMLSDDPSIFGKYIFFKGGKLIISINGVFDLLPMADGDRVINSSG